MITELRCGGLTREGSGIMGNRRSRSCAGVGWPPQGSGIMGNPEITELRQGGLAPTGLRDHGKPEITVMSGVITRSIVPDHGIGLITE